MDHSSLQRCHLYHTTSFLICKYQKYKIIKLFSFKYFVKMA
nr:hypothetical protein [uncultured bacterium]